MAKNSVSDWDATASNNLDVGGVNIGEGCPAANINNALREIMAQVKTFYGDAALDADIGTTIQAYDAALASIASGTADLSSLAVSGDSDLTNITASGDTDIADLSVSGDAEFTGFLSVGSPTTLGIVDDEITVTQTRHKVNTNDATPSADNLDTIGAQPAGTIIILSIVDNSRVVTMKHGIGNIRCGSDRVLNNIHDKVVLESYGTGWSMISFSDNA